MIEYVDLRGWIDIAKRANQLVELRGVPLNEVGVIAQLDSKNKGPAIYFKDLPGYDGFGILTNYLNNNIHLAITLGLDPNSDTRDLIIYIRDHYDEWLTRSKDFPPRFVDDGPILKNVKSDDDVDLTIFPVPKWHIDDGGPYIGTGDAVIMRDPEGDWINVGTYRVQLFGKNEVGLMIVPGHQGDLIMKKYFNSGKPVPVVMVFGLDPLLFIASSMEIPYGISELNFVGAIRGEGVPVIKGEVTGLPIPAYAEIAVEGFIEPGKVREEGPFGEYTGYYTHKGPAPYMRVLRLYYRDNAIITGMIPSKSTYSTYGYFRSVFRSAMIWGRLNKMGVQGINGVWVPEFGGSRNMVIVSMKQLYPGHATQVGALIMGMPESANFLKYVVIVDDDINPYDMEDVLWAVCTRVDPKDDVDIIRKTWSQPLDPRIRRPTNDWTTSTMIIRAVKPYDWISEFPKVAIEPEDVRREVFNKYGKALNWKTY